VSFSPDEKEILERELGGSALECSRVGVIVQEIAFNGYGLIVIIVFKRRNLVRKGFYRITKPREPKLPGRDRISVIGPRFPE
jgi:hypothetical protein